MGTPNSVSTPYHHCCVPLPSSFDSSLHNYHPELPKANNYSPHPTNNALAIAVTMSYGAKRYCPLPLQYRTESSLIIRMPLCMCSARRAGKSKTLESTSCIRIAVGRRSIIRLDPCKSTRPTHSTNHVRPCLWVLYSFMVRHTVPTDAVSLQSVSCHRIRNGLPHVRQSLTAVPP